MKLQLEQGSIATPYEPHIENVSYAKAVNPDTGEVMQFRSLPNGVKDEFDVTGGKVIQRIGVKTSVPSGTVINYADMATGGQFVAYDADGQVVQTGIKGDTLTADATQLNYQLATPIEIPAEVVGEARVYPGGSVEVTPCAWGYLTQATQTITDAAHPLKAIRAVYRYEYTASGGLRAVDVTADATIEENKTDISLANYDSSKTYFYDVDIDESSTTVGEINAKVEVNNGIVSHDYLAAAAPWILTANEAKATYLSVTNAGGAANIVAPAQDGKMYIIKNGTTQNVTIKTATSAGVVIATNKKATVIYNGADFEKISEVSI
jgi:hypothetical protein